MVLEVSFDKFSRLLNSLNYCLQKWSHEFTLERETDGRVQNFFKNNNLAFHKSINPRDALYGGRCSLFKLLAEVKDGEEIQYLDVVR